MSVVEKWSCRHFRSLGLSLNQEEEEEEVRQVAFRGEEGGVSCFCQHLAVAAVVFLPRHLTRDRVAASGWACPYIHNTWSKKSA